MADMLILPNWLNFRGVPVIMFHGLYEQLPEHVIFQGGMTCMLAINDFRRLIDWITKRFQVIRLADLDKRLAFEDRKCPQIVLTFDDGLASVIDLALPVLREYHISAVMFITTDWINSGRTPDIFLLEKTIWKHLPVNLVIPKLSDFFFRKFEKAYLQGNRSLL